MSTPGLCQPCGALYLKRLDDLTPDIQRYGCQECGTVTHWNGRIITAKEIKEMESHG